MNGSDVKREISNPSISTILLAINLVTMVGGFGVIWGTQASRLDAVSATEGAINTRVDLLSTAVVQDRVTLGNRLTNLESDIKYISQSISELKLRK